MVRSKHILKDSVKQVRLSDRHIMKTESLWTVEDMAQFLRLEPSTIRDMAKRGEFPRGAAIKMGRLWRFRRDMIEEWIELEADDTGEDEDFN